MYQSVAPLEERIKYTVLMIWINFQTSQYQYPPYSAILHTAPAITDQKLVFLRVVLFIYVRSAT
jgi:hypothetical protein